MRRIFLWLCLAIPAITTIYTQPVSDDLPQVTGCIAIVNATVVAAPGKAPARSTIVMRDGIITHAGPDIAIPPDAYRIAADSFYVYPAFIDAFSSTGIKEPETQQPGQGGGGPQGPGGQRSQRPPVDEDGNPSLEDAGITPFAGVRAAFDSKEKSISDWRAQGFAIAHVVPRGRMIPGRGAVVVLSGRGKDQMLWREDVSMFSQWTGAGGSYPATVIGIMAKWRELYTNASLYAGHQSVYEKATLVSRPKYNQAHEALRPVVAGTMPVYFRAPKIKDISRALELQKDLGMKLVIADAEEAWELKDRFVSGSIPLILSLKLPEDKEKAEVKAEAKPPLGDLGAEGQKGRKESEEKESQPLNASTSQPDKTESKSPLGGLGATEDKPTDPEKEAFEKRRAESLKAHRGQAGVLEKAGIPFSFGTMSAKPGDFSKNIRLMMEHELSFERVLGALTTQPARLLGIEKYCGTVEVGKMANVIVSTKPLFEKDAAIRYMIVEGQLYEYEVKERKKANDAASVVPAKLLHGTWSYAIEAPDQKREGKFVFTEKAGEVHGTISSATDGASGNDELEDIVVDGRTVSFTYDWDMGGQIITLEFDLDIDHDDFKGTVSVGPFGAFPITGARISKPE